MLLVKNNVSRFGERLPGQSGVNPNSSNWWRRKDYPRINCRNYLRLSKGGGLRDLRRSCAEQLLEIGFDGYGYGGWPLDRDGNLLTDMLAYTRELIPAQYPLHALGVGHPQNVVACFELGYGLFDSAMPTRDARHGRLYAYTAAVGTPGSVLKDNWLKFIYIDDERYMRLDAPVSPGCDCLTCRRYSLGYLRHLFKMNDSLYPRLATIHNLRFMTQLTTRLRMGVNE